MCMSCDVCAILLVMQILYKVSHNPAEAKKLRLVRIGRGTGSISSCQICTTSTTPQQVAMQRRITILTPVPADSWRLRIISSLLQSTSVNTILHVSEISIDIRSILLYYMSVSIV